MSLVLEGDLLRLGTRLSQGFGLTRLLRGGLFEGPKLFLGGLRLGESVGCVRSEEAGLRILPKGLERFLGILA